MKIKLKSLELPKKTGLLFRALTNSSSSKYSGVGIILNECYLQTDKGAVEVQAELRITIAYMLWLPYVAILDTQRVINNTDLIYIDKAIDIGIVNITSILWQSGNTIKLTIDNVVENLKVGEYITVSGATNSENNGLLKVTKILSDTEVEIENKKVSDNTKDEPSASAIVESVLERFQIENMQEQTYGEFENHYELTLTKTNT